MLSTVEHMIDSKVRLTYRNERRRFQMVRAAGSQTHMLKQDYQTIWSNMTKDMFKVLIVSSVGLESCKTKRNLRFFLIKTPSGDFRQVSEEIKGCSWLGHQVLVVLYDFFVIFRGFFDFQKLSQVRSNPKNLRKLASNHLTVLLILRKIEGPCFIWSIQYGPTLIISQRIF